MAVTFKKSKNSLCKADITDYSFVESLNYCSSDYHYIPPIFSPLSSINTSSTNSLTFGIPGRWYGFWYANALVKTLVSVMFFT